MREDSIFKLIEIESDIDMCCDLRQKKNDEETKGKRPSLTLTDYCCRPLKSFYLINDNQNELIIQSSKIQLKKRIPSDESRYVYSTIQLTDEQRSKNCEISNDYGSIPVER